MAFLATYLLVLVAVSAVLPRLGYVVAIGVLFFVQPRGAAVFVPLFLAIAAGLHWGRNRLIQRVRHKI